MKTQIDAYQQELRALERTYAQLLEQVSYDAKNHRTPRHDVVHSLAVASRRRLVVKPLVDAMSAPGAPDPEADPGACRQLIGTTLVKHLQDWRGHTYRGSPSLSMDLEEGFEEVFAELGITEREFVV